MLRTRVIATAAGLVLLGGFAAALLVDDPSPRAPTPLVALSGTAAVDRVINEALGAVRLVRTAPAAGGDAAKGQLRSAEQALDRAATGLRPAPGRVPGPLADASATSFDRLGTLLGDVRAQCAFRGRDDCREAFGSADALSYDAGVSIGRLSAYGSRTPAAVITLLEQAAGS